MVIAPNQPVLSAPVEGLSGGRGGAVGGRGGAVGGRGGVVGGRGGAVGSAGSGLPVVERAAAGVVIIMAGSYHKSRGLVPYVTRLRALCHERPYLMLRAAVVVTAVVMTVSALTETIGSELNTRSAAPKVEGRVAEME